MADTPNHDYNVPAKGTTDWHVLLNENFEKMDTDVEVRAGEDDTGNFTPKAAAKFLAVDTGTVYLGNGSAWDRTLTMARTGEPSTQRDAGNVIFGHAVNGAQQGVDGATVGGGGFDDGTGGSRNLAIGDYGTVGGGQGNRAAESATVGGGYGNDATGANGTVAGGNGNTARGDYSTVAGGTGNAAYGENATVGGGIDNDTSAGWTTIGGGEKNRADAKGATIGGGTDNDAAGERATVGGGQLNAADGKHATVPGGYDNTASAAATFAAGNHATADEDGAVVWGDSSGTEIQAGGPDEFRSQMPMYAPSFNTTSARAAKQDVEPVDEQAVLDGVESLDVRRWSLKEGDDGRHLGPMAGEFNEALDLDGEDAIATVDADGAALAAIQGLSQRLDEKGDRIDDLEATVEQRDDRIDDLEATVEQRDDRIDDLEAAVEERDDRIDDLEAVVEERAAELEALRSEVADLRAEMQE